MTTSFVPRPVYRIKKYGYVVEPGDTPSKIATKFGRPAGAYRELVAANLHGRTLMPMALGSPHVSRTFATLAEGELLKIPGTWPDPPGLEPSVLGEPGFLGDVVLDPLAQGMSDAAMSANAGSGNVYDPPGVQAITNAALQWWLNGAGPGGTGGTLPAQNPAQYMPYITSAMGWLNTHGHTILTETGSTTPVTSFPWGAFLGMLPAFQDITKVDWAGGTIAGTNGVPWASIPWTYLGTMGPKLEALKLPPVQWPSDTSPGAVLGAIQAAVAAAQAQPSPTCKQGQHVVQGVCIDYKAGDSCGQSSHVAMDLQCYCDPNFAWSGPDGTDCVPSVVPGAQTCPAGSTWDAKAPGGAGCFGCNAGQSYDLATHTCQCPANLAWDSVSNSCLPIPKSQADCIANEVFDAQGPIGAHCYACNAPTVYNTTTHKCECPAGTAWDGSACAAGAAGIEQACPKGFTWDKGVKACVQDAPPPVKTVLADDSGNRTALYAAVGLGILLLGGGGLYLATRPSSKKASK